MPIEYQFLGCAAFLALFFAWIAAMWGEGQKQVTAAREAWLRTGWTVVRQDVDRLRGRWSSVSTRAYRGFAVELVREGPPSSSAPFHETEGAGLFPSRWRTYLRVDLGSRRVCPFQLFERAALVKARFFSVGGVSAFGAVWYPRWLDRLSIGDPRLDSRFELYAEDQACAILRVEALATPLLAAPYFGVLEIVGSELRVYVSTRAAGLVGDYGAGLAAHLDALSDLIVDVASTLKNA